MKILGVYSNHPTGSSFYRLQMPYEHLANNYGVEYATTNSLLGTDKEIIKQFDAVVMCREFEHYGDVSLIKKAADAVHAAGAKIILDIDDYWNLSAFHILRNEYKAHGIPEKIKASIQEADYITTTTSYLAEKIYPLNNNVVVLPNAIYPEVYDEFVPMAVPEPFYRVGWFGGNCHFEDLMLLSYSMNKLHHDLELKGKYKITLAGYNEAGGIYQRYERILTSNYKCDNEAYRRINATDVYQFARGYNYVDAVMIPLNDNTFNNCKSELKMIEAGFMGKAAVVSNIAPYSDLIRHGENCLAVNNYKKDFYKHIKKLIKEPDYGRYLASNLQSYIKANYHISVVNKNRYEFLKSI